MGSFMKGPLVLWGHGFEGVLGLMASWVFKGSYGLFWHHVF